MKTRISLREIEALSSYLDNQLDPKERARLEARLQSDADLRAELEALRRTRAVLRSQPPLRAPRNFTLTPQMAGIRPSSRPATGPFPVFRLASVLATIFLVVVLAGDLLTRNMGMAPIPLSVSEQEAPPPAIGMGGGGGGGGADVAPAAVETVQVEEVAVERVAQPTQAAAEKAIQSTPAAEEALGLMVTPLGAAPTSTPLATPAPAELSMVQATPVQESVEVAEAVVQDQTQVEGSEEQRVLLSRPILRAIEILLALLAIITGLVAVSMRRSAKR